MLNALNGTALDRFKILSFLFFLFSVSYGFSQSCGGDLTVDKGRNVRSADEDGTQFSLSLVNTSSKSQTYQISTVELKESCATDHYKSTAPNVNLNISVLQKNDSQVKEITLAKGETAALKVQVNVPAGTPFNRWSCIEVQAQAKSCNSVASAMLRVFVPDNSEE